MGLVPDPIADGGIAGFGRRLRGGETTAEAATRAYLDRIAALNPRLDAYERVDADTALVQARALDAMLAAGTDLGPLMGVAVAVKDIFAVDPRPTGAGSNVDVKDLTGREGGFVRSLRRAGCVLLGKAKTVEFALGGTGINATRGTPWNPCDATVHRIPGGSSSGSGVAVAAGLAAFAIGSDTGGSIRSPAAFCGVFGLKTTVGLWPTDGVFPLSSTLDTVGLLTADAADAALVFAALTGTPMATPHPWRGLRLGRPSGPSFQPAELEVGICVDAALAALAARGVAIDDVDVPEAEDAWPDMGAISPAEILASLGRERFAKIRSSIDPDVAMRIAPALDREASAYIATLARHRALARTASRRMDGFDGWVSSTVPFRPVPVASLADPAEKARIFPLVARASRLANYMDLCATSMPVQHLGGSLPVGLQILGRANDEARTLGVALAIEEVIGKPARPNLDGFLGS